MFCFLVVCSCGKVVSAALRIFLQENRLKVVKNVQLVHECIWCRYWCLWKTQSMFKVQKSNTSRDLQSHKHNTRGIQMSFYMKLSFALPACDPPCEAFEINQKWSDSKHQLLWLPGGTDGVLEEQPVVLQQRLSCSTAALKPSVCRIRRSPAGGAGRACPREGPGPWPAHSPGSRWGRGSPPPRSAPEKSYCSAPRKTWRNKDVFTSTDNKIPNLQHLVLTI